MIHLDKISRIGKFPETEDRLEVTRSEVNGTEVEKHILYLQGFISLEKEIKKNTEANLKKN